MSRLENVSTRAGRGATEPKVSRGCAFGDFDNDGDVDVVVNNLNGAPSLLRNDCISGGNWVKVKCTGTKSNRSAIGARVRVVTGEHSQIEEIMSGSSYVSQNDLRLHFGLGKAEKLDRVEVRWPLGLVEIFPNLGVNLLLTINEGNGIVEKTNIQGRP